MTETTQPQAAAEQPVESQTKAEQEESFVSRSLHSSIHEDAEEAPKFVPKDTLVDGAQASGTGPMILARRTTFTAKQIKQDVAATESGSSNPAAQHNSLLDCTLCKNVLIDARECDKCRKGFCKACIDDYIDQLIKGEYEICCPNCSEVQFQLVDPHPLLKNQLAKMKFACENAELGCTVTVSYDEVHKHKTECDFATLKCPNFGCEFECYQKDFAAHEASCEFRVIRCEQCDVIKKKDEEHNCVKSMAAKYEHMEQRLIQVSQRLELALERAERTRLDAEKGTKLVRYEIGLPAFAQLRINAQFGLVQQIVEMVHNLPANTRAIILRFGLTDLNMRRDYDSLVINQVGSAAKVDLTNCFFVGQQPVPIFGASSEVMMPWDENLENKLELNVTASPSTLTPQQPYGNPYQGNPYGGYGHGYPGMPHPPHPPHHQAPPNPFAYATISVVGFMYKC